MASTEFYQLMNDGTLGVQLPATETVTAAKNLTEAHNGMTFFLAALAGFEITLPLPKAGLRYSFVVATAPTSVGYTIVTNGGANIIQGWSVTAATGAANLAVNEDKITLVHNQAIAADRVDLICDGTNWYVGAVVSVVAAVTFSAT